VRKIYILAAALAVLFSGSAYAASPGLISYQGTLRKDGRLFSGTVSMEFSITDASGATEYWNSGSTDVVVSTGLFRYPLGTPNEADFTAIPWKDITPYVRMSLDGGWLQPEPLYSSVYSLHSVTAEASTGTFTVNNGDLKLAGAAGSRGIVYTDNTVQRTAPGWAASGQHAVLTGTGYAGLGLAGPQTRLDVQAAAADSYSQFWRNSGGVIVASMSAGGTLYADAAGLRNIAGDGLGSHTATQDLNMANRRIASASSLGLNAAVSLSSASALHYGGVYFSSHVYLAPGARYYGDGSQLSNVSGSDDLGDHTLTQNLVLGANWVSGDGGGEGLAVDAVGNVGVGEPSPEARLDVRGDAGGYAQIWRDGGGVVQASMSATGVLYAAASGLRGLPAGALGDDLGSHVLGQNLAAGTFWYSGDGGSEGLFVDAGGNVGVSTNAPAARLDVRGAVAGNSQIWRSAAGTAVATMTAAGVLYADGSGLTNIAETDPVFAAHPAYAILAGERAAWNGAAAWGDHAVAGYASLAQANTFASSATFTAQHPALPGVLVSSGLVVANGSVGIGTASPQQRLDVNGAVRLGDSSSDVPGSIRYSGSSFEGYNGSAWVALNGAYTNDNSALWAVGTDTVYMVGTASSVAIGQSTDAGNSKLLVRANTDGATENAFRAENFTGFPLLIVRNDGNIGAGTEIPEARLDVLTVPAAPRSQIWRDQFGTIVSSMSAAGVIYADGSGLRNIAGDGLGGHTASQAFNLAGNQILNASSVTVTGAQGIGTARLALAPGVALSSATAAYHGGVYVSTHVYLSAGARYYGDGSALSNVGGDDNLGDHTLTQALITGSNWISGDGDPEGLYVDSTGNAGIGTAAPSARLDVLGDQGGYIQFWRNNSGVAQATMTAVGVLHADGSALRNLSATALTAGALPDARLSPNVPLLGAAANTFTGSLSVTGAGGAAASRFRLASGVEISSSAPAFNGGVYVSSNVYVVGIASAAKYYGDGSELTGVSGSDDLGDHTLTQNLRTGSNWISGDGGGEGLAVDASGNVGVGESNPGARLDVRGDSGGYSQIWRDAGGVILASMSAAGMLYADGSALRNLPPGGGAETDPVFTAHSAFGISGSDISGWNAAYGWGDHAAAGYASKSANQTISGANTFSSAATFTQQNAVLPGVSISSGLIVAAGSLGVGTAGPLQRLDVNGGIRLGNTTADVPGSMRYSGGSFEGYNGAAWVALNGSYTADSSALWNVTADTVYTVGVDSGVAIGSSAAGANKLRVTGADNGAGANAFLAESQNQTALLVVRNDGNMGVGTLDPATRLDVTADAAGYAQFWRDNGGVIVASMTDAGVLYADAAGLRNLPAGGGSDDLGDHTATKPLDLAGNWMLNVSTIVGAPSEPGITVSTSLFVGGAVGILGSMTGASLDVGTSAEGYVQFWRNAGGAVVATMTATGVLYADGSQLTNLPGGGGAGTLSEVLTAGNNAGGLDIAGLGDLTLAGNLTAYSSMTVNGALGVTGGVKAEGSLSAGGVLASTISSSGYLALANLNSSPSGTGPGTLYYNPTAFAGKGALYLNLNGTFVPISTGTVASGGGGGTLSDILSAGGDAGGFGMTNLGDVAIGATSAAAPLDVQGGGGYIQLWRNSTGVIVASMTNTGEFYAGNIAGGGGGGALSCVNPNDPSDILVQVGDFCVDKYEATVWSTPTGGTQYGAASDNYLCDDDGQNCGQGGVPIYARSVSGFTPSAYITWFQAAAACANSGKHLITNAEWQAAVMGTPKANCTNGGDVPAQTGSGGACVSSFLAENMVGSLWEIVSDLGLYSANNDTGTWGNLEMASGAVPNPLAVTARGGSAWMDNITSGPLAFIMGDSPFFIEASLGFRCAMQLR